MVAEPKPGGAGRSLPPDVAWSEIIDSTPGPMIMSDPDGRIVLVNRAAESMLGYTRAELLRLSVDDLLPAELRDRHPMRRAGYGQQPARRILGGGRDLYCVRKDGSRLHVEIGLNPVRSALGTYVLASLVDMSERVELQRARALAQADRLRRTTLDHLPFSVITTDADGIILAANPAAELMLQAGDGALEGRSLADLHDPGELSACATELGTEHVESGSTGFAVLRALGEHHADRPREWSYLALDGSVVQVAETVVALRGDDGEVEGFLAGAYDITRRVAAEAEVHHLAHHDSLTGLPNRAFLVSVVDEILTRRPSARLALLVVDLDHFKRVNDTLGHHVGDEVLRAASVRIREGAGPGAVTARIGGDAFATVIDVLDDDDALVRARTIQQAVATTGLENDLEVVGVSIGVALAGRDGLDATELLKNADSAMYQAKIAGRNTLKVFTPSMLDADREKLQLASGLRRALGDGEVTVSYQPIVDLRSGEVVSFEALARWTSPRFGIVSPSRFIPLAEDHGLISDLGERVLRTACQDIASLTQALGRDVGLSVNVSPQQFRNRDLPQIVRSAADEAGIDPSFLELEITENILVANPREVVDVMRAVRELGAKIVIDDFGTGFSSLGYLTRMPIDKIKIDRSFVTEISHNERDASIVDSIILLAHTLGMGVTAEGIETREQEQYLRERHCDQGQGFLYSAAVPIAAAHVVAGG